MSNLQDRVQGRIVYFLATIIVLHLTYPLSEMGTLPSIGYLLIYVVLLALGISMAAASRRRVGFAVGSAIGVTVMGALWNFNPESVLLTYLTFGSLLSFLVLIAYTIAEYVFQARAITRDVLYAGVATYLLIGNIFTVWYVLVEVTTQLTMDTSAFTLNGEVTWQKMFYFSYTTLTTLGYGDILPATSAAQSFATLEAIIGVLYVAILVGRLVGVYAQEQPTSDRLL